MRNGSKLIVSLLLTLLVAGNVSAQERKSFQTHLRLGIGPFIETGSRTDSPGLSARLSVGVEKAITEQWSLMAGGGHRTQLSDIAHIGWVGGDPDGISLADVFLCGRYRTDEGKVGIVLGLGPQVSIKTSKETYYVDSDPNDPRNNEEKFHKTDIGIQPSAYVEVGKHWEFGLEGCVGLRNMRIHYPEYNVSGSTRMHTFLFTAGFRF